jgi:hypothetical protein
VGSLSSVLTIKVTTIQVNIEVGDKGLVRIASFDNSSHVEDNDGSVGLLSPTILPPIVS